MFEFRDREKEWQEFRTKTGKVFDERVKPVLREQPTSDVTLMVHKLEFFAGWLPWIAEMRAKAEMFYKMARAEALSNCPFATPELKVRIWLEGEIAEVEYFFNHLDAIYKSGTDAGMKLQTCLRVEMDLKNISGKGNA